MAGTEPSARPEAATPSGRAPVGSEHVSPSGHAVLDLDYAEDSKAETDMNIVMTQSGGFIELQGTGEDGHFTNSQLQEMIALAESGIQQLIKLQQQSLIKFWYM